MRVELRKVTSLAASLLLAAGLGVFPVAAQARNSTTRKPASSATKKASHGKKSLKKTRRRERGQQAPTSDRIAEIQQALAKDGSYAGTPNGQWDDSTMDAMRKFQESHGLSPTGKLDAKTLQQLGLGSSITGVAAPLPSNTTSKLAPPSTRAVQRPR